MTKRYASVTLFGICDFKKRIPVDKRKGAKSLAEINERKPGDTKKKKANLKKQSNKPNVIDLHDLC